MSTEAWSALQGRRILVAASGSIAAVKTPLLVSALIKSGAQVRCVVTDSAARLVSPVALASLSRHRCYQDLDQWDPAFSRPLHIELAEWAELIILAPLSAGTLSRWSHGSADNLLASLLMAAEVPLLAAPAMNTAMWLHPAVQRNWAEVLGFPGVVPLLPSSGLLACDRVGDGRMADPALIQLAAAALFSRSAEAAVAAQDWTGQRFLVTAGPTREPIDGARVLSNNSSGRMGVLLAQAARLRGAAVDLVHGPLTLPEAWLEGLECCPVDTATELETALRQRQESADAVVMAAAVADLRRDAVEQTKLAKLELPNVLSKGWVEVPDLLAGLAERRPERQLLLGFAALSGDEEALIRAGERKRIAKGCQLMFVNPIDLQGQGFGDQANGGWLLGDGWKQELPVMSKLALAQRLLDGLLMLRAAESGTS